MDLNLGGPIDGLRAVEVLVERHPEVRVILMSGLADERQIESGRAAGAIGYLPKDLVAADMVDAIRRLVAESTSGRPARGRRMPPMEVAGDRAPFEPLSPREMEVLHEVRQARTNREIAERLHLSTSTVNKHVSQVLRKLRARNRAEAAIIAASVLARPRQSR
jgi:NarL family two-component system response regulator LiaR